jgi:hypothetical protein
MNLGIKKGDTKMKTNKKASHTPGPWNYDWFNSPTVKGELVLEVYALNDPRRLVRVNDSMENSEANARLIAAAPQLLAMAKNLLEAIDYNGESDTQEVIGDKVELRAAIARAEGRS